MNTVTMKDGRVIKGTKIVLCPEITTIKLNGVIVETVFTADIKKVETQKEKPHA